MTGTYAETISNGNNGTNFVDTPQKITTTTYKKKTYTETQVRVILVRAKQYVEETTIEEVFGKPMRFLTQEESTLFHVIHDETFL